MEDNTVLTVALIVALVYFLSSPIRSIFREYKDDVKCLKNHWGQHKILGRYSSDYIIGDALYSGSEKGTATGYKVQCQKCGRIQNVDDRQPEAFRLAHPNYKGEDVDGRKGLYGKDVVLD